MIGEPEAMDTPARAKSYGVEDMGRLRMLKE